MEAIDVCRHFNLPGAPVLGHPYGTGHINDTFRVLVEHHGRRVPYILQRINRHVFPDIPALMENIDRVTRHLQGKVAGDCEDPERRCLRLIPTHDGATWYRDERGEFWRMYVFIEGAHTVDVCTAPEQAEAAASAFGLFQKQLSDLPPPRLHETIRGFHDTPSRLNRFREVLNLDPMNRAAEVGPEIAFVEERAWIAPVLVNAQRDGTVPERTVHCDTKINNVMLDNHTGEGVCVIDLDTVMPGLTLYDFGDQVRSTASGSAEDTRHLDTVQVRVPYFEALVRGYLTTAGEFLTEGELDHLAFSGRLISFENAIRFLTDYLEGDVYFRTHRPGQNLDRTRTHLRLVEELEQKETALEDIVRRYRS
jgi:Ser/Thr protein kinase RdoA (MazF antagonist)